MDNLSYFFASLKSTTTAILQIALLGLCGYYAVKMKAVLIEHLQFLSKLVINFLLPCFIFIELVENFTFSIFTNWWIFPLLSICITLLGVCIALFLITLDKSLNRYRHEFVSLIAFQNSGYLPLMLVALLFPAALKEQMYVYIFLFLLGFNLIIWSVGSWYLTKKENATWQMRSLLTPPIIATVVALLTVLLRAQQFIPQIATTPLHMLGKCALPLAIFVVGGNLALASIRIRGKSTPLFYIVFAKLVIVPTIALAVIALTRPSYAVSFLFLLECAVPSATSLGVITHLRKSSDTLISVGIFWTHVISLITIPLFLSALSFLLER